MNRRPSGIGRSQAGQAGDFAVRRPKTRRSWRRIWFRIGGVVLSLAAVGSAAWWLLTAPLFAVDKVQSGAYRFTSEAELEGVFAQFLGHNIWTLSTDDVYAQLNRLPWIRDLRVSRRLPGTLEVDFREWRPLLVVAGDTDEDSNTPQVLAQDGRVLPFPDHLVLAGLPVLVDVPVVTDSTGNSRRLDPALAAQVLDLTAAMETTGLEAVSPVDFLVARSEGFVIVLQDGQGTLRVGREAFAQRLSRYMDARSELAPGLEVDLRFKDRITFTERDTPKD